MPVPTFDETMDFFAPHNREVFDLLCGLVREKRIVPFIGSGMSAFCFPTFKGFLADLHASQFPNVQMPDKLLDAATKLERKLGKNAFLKEIALAYGGTPGFDWDEVAAKAQDEPVAMLSELFGNMAVTTNRDRVLETVYGPGPVVHPSCFEQLGLALAQGGDRLVFKIYGSVEDQPGMIVTREDYERSYGSGREHAKALKSAFGKSSFLFLGCSLDDQPDIRWGAFSQAGYANKKEGSGNFAILACRPQDRQARHRELSGKNIQAILYDESDHTAVRVLLEGLYSQAFGRPYAKPEKKPPVTLPKRNPNFFGRQKQLLAISESFREGSEGKRSSHILAIEGIAGVGKSQLALEYAHFNLERYTDGICWLDAEDEASLLNSAFVFAQKAGFGGKQTSENLPAWIADWIATRSMGLVVFDGAVTRHLAPYLPDNAASHVLITPRDNAPGTSRIALATFALEPFTHQESTAFLLERTASISGKEPDANDETEETEETEITILAELASRLACLPLALEQAATSIARQGISFAVYLESLGQAGHVPIDSNIDSNSDPNHQDIVAATCARLLSQVELADPAAMQLFCVCARYNPSPIPLEVLATHRKSLPSPLRERISTQEGIEAMVGLLEGFSLVQARGFNTLGIHRAVRDAVKDKLDIGTHYLDAAFAVMSAATPKEYGTGLRDYALFNRLGVHAFVVAGQFAESHGDDIESQKSAADLFERVGQGCLDVMANDEYAMGAFLRCLDIREEVLEEDHRDTATCYANIASAHDSMGDLDEALECYDMAIEMLDRTSGLDSHEAISCLNAKGNVYLRKGEHDLAMEAFSATLLLCERHYRKPTPDMAASLNGMAMAYLQKSETGEALELFLKTLGMREAVLGYDQPDTIATCINIANIYGERGDFDKALELYGKSLDMYSKVLGPEHSILSTVLNNMGMTYWDNDDLDEALECQLKALHICEKALHPAHPRTAHVCEDIAKVFVKEMDVIAAQEWCFRALAIRERSLGKSHPDTINCCKFIAALYLAELKLPKALKWFAKAQLRRLARRKPDR